MCQGGSHYYFDGVEVWVSNFQPTLLAAAGFELLCNQVNFSTGTKSGDTVRGPQVFFGLSANVGNYWHHSTQMITSIKL
jgi:hypothetical protein